MPEPFSFAPSPCLFSFSNFVKTRQFHLFLSDASTPRALGRRIGADSVFPTVLFNLTSGRRVFFTRLPPLADSNNALFPFICSLDHGVPFLLRRLLRLCSARAHGGQSRRFFGLPRAHAGV